MLIKYKIILLLQYIVALAPCLSLFLHCNKSFVDTVCFKNEKYIPTNSPNPLPTKVNITINFFNVINVDPEEHSVTLMLKMGFRWIDKRLHIQRSEDYEKR